MINLYLGHDGESFYMNRAARDMREVLRDQRVCEIDASEVRSYSLSEAFRRLDKKEDKMVEEKWKPIMAERNREAESELEAEEDQDTEESYVGAIEEQEEESEPIELEKPANSTPGTFRQDKESNPVEPKKRTNSPASCFQIRGRSKRRRTQVVNRVW